MKETNAAITVLKEENSIVLSFSLTDSKSGKMQEIGIALTPEDAIVLGNEIHARAFDSILDEQARLRDKIK